MDSGEKLFRFENLEIWQRAADIGFQLGGVADALEQQRLYKYAEQLRAAAISISNNIAEGSGSNSNSEIRQFLNYARRSVFECASMILLFDRQHLLPAIQVPQLLAELSRISRMITSLSRTLD